MKRWHKQHHVVDPDAVLIGKINSCRMLVIQSMEKTIFHKMFDMYLKAQQIQNQVEQYRISNQSGLIRLTFHTAEQAKNFYENRNFIDKILSRKFNIYLDLSASEYQIRRYFVKGVNEDNIRNVFEKCRQYGVVRLNTLYGYKKMKDTCIVCYLRTSSLSAKDFDALANQLQKFNVKLDQYRDRPSNLSQIRPNISQIKPLAKEIVSDQQSDSQKITFTIMTIHDENGEEAVRSVPQLIEQTFKWFQCKQQKIFIDRFLIPTLNPDKNQILLVRDIEFEQMTKASQKFAIISAKFKEQKVNSILYLNDPKISSTLVVTLPLNYVVKAQKGVLVILSRTEQKEKLIKIAHLEYEEIDQFIFEEQKMKVNLYKSSQIDNFGTPIDNLSEDEDL